MRRFVRFSGLRHPAELGRAEVTAFLSHLAEREGLSAASQNQAPSALGFLYEAVLGRRLGAGGLEGMVRAKEPGRLPVVLTKDEVRRVLAELRGVNRLVVLLLYGSGLRLLEALELRVKDVDFERGEIRVRSAKGGGSRVTMLAVAVAEPLRAHLVRGTPAARKRPSGWGWGRAVARGARAEVARRRARLAVAVGVSCNPGAPRGRRWRYPASSLARVGRPARRPPCSHGRRDRQAGDVSHLPPLIRHASPRGGVRHPDLAGAARSS